MAANTIVVPHFGHGASAAADSGAGLEVFGIIARSCAYVGSRF
jgi:hypothetical protein